MVSRVSVNVNIVFWISNGLIEYFLISSGDGLEVKYVRK